MLEDHYERDLLNTFMGSTLTNMIRQAAIHDEHLLNDKDFYTAIQELRTVILEWKMGYIPCLMTDVDFASLHDDIIRQREVMSFMLRLRGLFLQHCAVNSWSGSTLTEFLSPLFANGISDTGEIEQAMDLETAGQVLSQHVFAMPFILVYYGVVDFEPKAVVKP